MKAMGYDRIGGRDTITKDILICIKCGSDKIKREENNILCEECGAVLFFTKKVSWIK